MTPQEEKQRLRRHYLEQRRSLSEDQRRACSERILGRVWALPKVQAASTVLSYVAHDGEVETLPLIQRLLAEGRVVGVPTLADEGPMEWSVLDRLKDLAPGKYGILAPRIPRLLASIPPDAVCIVPGIAWSRERYRLGYGGGYFDRFLSIFGGFSIGLAYHIQVCDSLPLELHDRPVHCLLTELQVL